MAWGNGEEIGCQTVDRKREGSICSEQPQFFCEAIMGVPRWAKSIVALFSAKDRAALARAALGTTIASLAVAVPASSQEPTRKPTPSSAAIVDSGITALGVKFFLTRAESIVVRQPGDTA